eukprot:TRINITY_DN7640_c0_g1_i1.p1 TRINITY_DN7640_c0_g1~~TRINITY_DN7640_c0_g1_i1.p1  ORF type:complete len:578 (-),score=111.56 TRINITY_DN7640_c0_g1_i1:41-1600(-)
MTRDNVSLYTVVWAMRTWEKISPRPVVYIRSPYPRFEQDVALPWLEQGYSVVQQDMRGMEYSNGTFSFFRHAGDDSYDTMEWISQQKWSNGVVFSMGISADGINAYCQSLAKPKWLKSQLLIWASGIGYGIPYDFHGGVMKEALVDGWLTSIFRPLMITEVKDHEVNSTWYPSLVNKFSNVDFPAVHWGGWFDIFQNGQIDTFLGFQYESKRPGDQYLVMTPHGHCIFSIDVEPFPKSETLLAVYIASKLFKENSGTSMNPNLVLKDYKYDKVNFYVMAPRSSNPDNVGNYYTSLPKFPTPSYTQYFLGSSNTISKLPGSNHTYSYYYDPFLPVMNWGGNNLFGTCGPRDQRLVEDRPDVLVFHTEPLKENLAITGVVIAHLTVSTNREDTDFTVKIMDEHPNKFAELITEGITRLKFRESVNAPKKAVPYKEYQIEVNMKYTSWIFPKGHKIRVSVTSSNYPRYQANINEFKPIKDWSILDGKIASNKIHAGGKLSSITLPVVDINGLPKNPDIGFNI